MKKTFTLLFGLAIGATAFAQEIPNADFENWTEHAINEYDSLDYWHAGLDYFNVDQNIVKIDGSGDVSPQKGDYCMKIQPSTFIDNGVWVNMGNDLEFVEDSLLGYIQYDIADEDTATISVRYWSKDGTPLSGQEMLLTGKQSEWTMFSLNIKQNANADSVSIFFSSSKDESREKESYLWVDNIWFVEYEEPKDTGDGIGSHFEKVGFSTFPNPVTNQLNIQFDNVADISKVSSIELMDMAGRIVGSYSKHTDVINTQEFDKGMYMLRVRGAGILNTKTIVIE